MAQFTNQAQLTYSGGAVNSNVAVGELLEVLSASKTALGDSYGRGEDITYVISLVNSGNTVLTGVTVSDDLGGYAFDGQTLYPLDYVEGSLRLYADGVLQGAPNVNPGPPLVVSGLNVPAEGSLMLIYRARVTAFAPPGDAGSITNTATVSGSSVGTPITVSETVFPEAEPSLTVTKTVSPVPVTENGQLTYTFLIQNTGSRAAVATDDVTLTDDFDPILRGLTVTLDGVPLSEPGDYTYNETTGRFATLPGRITVPAATFAQDTETGAWVVTPGVTQLVVTGTV